MVQERVAAPHPQSQIHLKDGRTVDFKVHQCQWSGAYPPNSLPAILECYHERVVRAEVDIAMLADEDFLVAHDLELSHCTNGSGRVDQTSRVQSSKLRLLHHGRASSERPVLLSQVVDAVATEPFPTLLELDLKDWYPWPWPRIEELARMVQSVKDRITFGGGADWNLRRLHRVDSSLPMGFTITEYLDWVPPNAELEPLPGVWGAYGYLDAHPLSRQRTGPTHDYLRDRLGAILRLVPRAREIHIRLCAAEHMVQDGLRNLAAMLHEERMLLDVWTLDADTPNWQTRLARALAMGADVVTTNTPRELARAASAE
jgi:glycerophosphoryl diester phosphodiesterase